MLYQQINQNKRKTIFLTLLFCLVVLGIGWAIGYLYSQNGLFGITISLLILLIYVPITYMTATAQVLKIAGAKEIQKEDFPMLFNIVEELSLAARIPTPKIYLIDEPAPNAFATGINPEKGAVAFTTGLIERLDREELEGVVAHEISHIRNFDIRLMTICIALVGVVALIADIGTRMLFYGNRGNRDNKNGKSNPIFMIVAIVFMILAPIVAQFVHFAISRNREYLADASAVELTRNSVGLKNALIKISQSPEKVKNAKEATAAMYISNPFKKDLKKRGSLFATHPPIESRIERLEKM